MESVTDVDMQQSNTVCSFCGIPGIAVLILLSVASRVRSVGVVWSRFSAGTLNLVFGNCCFGSARKNSKKLGSVVEEGGNFLKAAWSCNGSQSGWLIPDGTPAAPTSSPPNTSLLKKGVEL